MTVIAHPRYDKWLIPLQEVTTITEGLLNDAFGALMGDQREGVKRIYTDTWALRTLLMDVISNLGLENVARRDYVRRRFDGYLESLVTTPHALLDGMDGPLSDEQATAIQFIGEVGQQLQAYVAQLWVFSQLHTGSMFFRPGTTTVNHILDPQGWPVTTADVQLELQIADDCPRITGDGDLLREAARQLVANAVQYTQHGYVRVSAYPHRHKPMVEIIVTDSGCGIPVQHASRIFDPFYQADGREDGLGLGLSIVRSICIMHGAEVAHTAHIQGTTFTMCLHQL